MAIIPGTPDDDILRGTPEDDEIYGLAGNDRIWGRAGDDLIWGGRGDDIVRGGPGNDRIWGGPGNDVLHGNGGADQLFGGSGDDVLHGNGGPDRLHGGPGNDQLFGGGGRDWLFGGPGQNTLTGGPGADRFVFRLLNQPVDTIADYNPEQGDHLHFGGALQGAAVRMVDQGADTLVRVKPASADEFTDLVILEDFRQPIDVWYGDHQQFGSPGEAQRWVNILGTVSPDVVSLSYSLNGGAERELSIGPDTRRLHEPGDFNADLLYAELDPSANDDVVTIRATFAGGEVFTRDVTIDYEGGQQWPAAYSIDWATVTDLQEAVQVVDGLWSFNADGVRPAVQGYDRVLAFGDRSWDNFEVELTVTLHDLTTVDPRGRDGGNFSVGMLWDGHTDNPVAGMQPKSGWIPHVGFYFENVGGGQFTLHPSYFFGPLDQQAISLQEGTTYNIKVRNERTEGFDRTYSLKIWEQGEAEPEGWLLQATEPFSELQTGSFFLNAHYYDVTFGDVTVTPLPGLEVVQSEDSLDGLLASAFGEAAPATLGAAGAGREQGTGPAGATGDLSQLVVSGDEALAV